MRKFRPAETPALRDRAARLILPIRGQRVLLDFQLAGLYGVETRALKQAVRRNAGRFPEDFMFELTAGEVDELVSQNVIPCRGQLGGALPMAFTEQGVAMEKKYDRQFKVVFDAIRQLMASPEGSDAKKEIGFHVREAAARYTVKRHHDRNR